MEKSGQKRKREPQQQGESVGINQMESIATNGTVHLEALECPICNHRLTPSVFQCAVGHVVCSNCYDKLKNKDRCYTCSITGGYNRCIAIERILQAVRVPCSNYKYGCTAKVAYYGDDEHTKTCPHAKCFCPEPGCGFAGTTAELLSHFTAQHNWPSTKFKLDAEFTLDVQEGMRVLHSKDGPLLFLLKFTPAGPLGDATFIVCVEPHPAEPKFRCRFSFQGYSIVGWESSEASRIISSTTLSEGFPTDRCVFVVPKVTGLPSKITIKLRKP